MKKITLLLLLITMTGLAQINGNGTLTTQTYDVEPIKTFELNLYAKVTLDAALPSQIRVQAEANLINKIDVEVIDGVLNLSQKEWIEPTAPIVITIGVPNIESITVDTHETVIVKNIDQEQLAVTALIGKVEVSGVVSTLNLNAESGVVDARDLQAQDAILNVWEDGRIIVNAVQTLSGTLSDDARLTMVNTPEKVASTISKQMQRKDNVVFKDAKYISFKIKNNSWGRNHFQVKGPKKDGGYFGYGFPMMPGAVKKERWTVGTKVFKVNNIGLRKLLVEIKAEDEGTTINLFEN